MKKISITKRDAKINDVELWSTKTPEERLSAVEFLREQVYIIQGYYRLPSITRKIIDALFLDEYVNNNFSNGSEKFAIDNNTHRKYFNQGPLKNVQYMEVKEKYPYD
jgi:hypothetical protein